MKILKNIIDFLVEGSIIVGLSVYSLAFITVKSLGVNYSNDLMVFLFFGTVFGYNFIKYLDDFKLHRSRPENKKFQSILLLSFVSAVVSGFYFLKLDDKVKLSLLIPVLITIFYTIPVFKKTLRTLSGFKIYVIAFSWMYITVLIPLIHFEIPIGFNELILCLGRFVFIFVIMLPFEIRDMQTDEVTLKTIPQRYGLIKTFVIGVVGSIIWMLISMLYKGYEGQEKILYMVLVLLMLCVTFSKPKQSKYFSSVLVESIPVIWLLLLLQFN